jgi:hypothetical protein
MAKDAKVIYQISGAGVVVFAGQSEPAIAITAGRLKQLHELAKSLALESKSDGYGSDFFKHNLQSLQNSLADYLLELQESGAKHGHSVKQEHRIAGSSDFITLEPQ